MCGGPDAEDQAAAGGPEVGGGLAGYYLAGEADQEAGGLEGRALLVVQPVKTRHKVATMLIQRTTEI